MALRLDPALLARTYRDPVSWAGLAVDLLPVWAVLALGWGAAPLVFLYWLENLVIGFVTLLRILASAAWGGVASLFGGVFMAAFFTVHYGMFCFVHGQFLSVFAGMATGDNPDFLSPVGLVGAALASGPGMSAILAVILGFNLFLFTWDGLLGRDLETSTPSEEMSAPYGRILVLHFGLFAGFGALMALGEPMLGVLGLIVLRVVWGVFLSARRRLRLEAGEKPDAVSRLASSTATE